MKLIYVAYYKYFKLFKSYFYYLFFLSKYYICINNKKGDYQNDNLLFEIEIIYF